MEEEEGGVFNPLVDICNGLEDYNNTITPLLPIAYYGDDIESPCCQRKKKKNNMVDLSIYYRMKQQDVADLLDMPISALSKKWGEVTNKQEIWPYRPIISIEATIKKFEKTGCTGNVIQNLKQELERLLSIPAKIDVVKRKSKKGMKKRKT